MNAIKKLFGSSAASAAAKPTPTDLEKEVAKLREELRKAHNIRNNVSDDDLLNEARQKRLDDDADFKRATAAHPGLAASANAIGANNIKDLARGIYGLLEQKDREKQFAVDNEAGLQNKIHLLEAQLKSRDESIVDLKKDVGEAAKIPRLELTLEIRDNDIVNLNDTIARQDNDIKHLKAPIKSLLDDLETERKLSSHYHAEVKRMAKDNESKNGALITEFKRQLALVAATNTTVTHTDQQTADKLAAETERANTLQTLADGLKNKLDEQASVFATSLKEATTSLDNAVNKVSENSNKSFDMVTAALSKGGYQGNKHGGGKPGAKPTAGTP